MAVIDYDKLIIDSSKGDMLALEALYDDLYKGVFALTLSITRDYGMSQDIVQDTFIRVKLYGHKFKPNGKGRAWIYKITRNLSLNAKKSAGRLLGMDKLNGVADSAPSLNDVVSDSILLKKALEILSEKEREVVIMHAVTGMLHREIAAILSIPVSTVKSRYRTAIKKLSAELSVELSDTY